MKKVGIPVPEFYRESEGGQGYLQQDLGQLESGRNYRLLEGTKQKWKDYSRLQNGAGLSAPDATQNG